MYNRVNMPLLSGSLLILLVASLAIWGPSLAPRDPNQINYIVRIGEEWISAPFPPFKVPGFPLGSDQQGRDILSQLMWAVRPTMIMVSIVALVRLMLGTIIGLLSGWSAGRKSRVLDTLISGALSAPALIVSLAVIAALGIELGVWAFIAGLTITGWAETARFVREQTSAIKDQLYVEAARALGISGLPLLVRHVVAQIRPMLWMLLSFEVSNTLLATAALGFLGYYIGGEVWVAVTDTTAARIYGMPELGLMLASLSTDIFTGPWRMAAAGSMVFITILGFNLLGEGLRLGLDLERPRGRLAITIAKERLALWIDDRIVYPITTWTRSFLTNRTSIGLAVILVGALIIWWRVQAPPQTVDRSPDLANPGGHLWATERHDPWGTFQSEAIGPKKPKVLWTFNEPNGFSGGPAIEADGTLYLASLGSILYAIDPDGKADWQAPLPAIPVGSPALGENDRIYIADVKGGLSAFSLEGKLLWHFKLEQEFAATAGPIVASNGKIYYPLGGMIQAVSPAGESLWREIARPYRASRPPQIVPPGDYLYLEDALVSREDGLRQEFEALAGANQFMVGADGKNYLRIQQQYVVEWKQTGNGFEIGQPIEWAYQRVAFGIPRDAGITAEQYIWLLYWTGFEDARLVWLDKSGRVLSNSRLPQRPAKMLGIDGESITYICGNTADQGPECAAYGPRSDSPIWRLPITQGTEISGGAIVAERLYVALRDGFLYAIGNAD